MSPLVIAYPGRRLRPHRAALDTAERSTEAWKDERDAAVAKAARLADGSVTNAKLAADMDGSQ